jgi:hypothetical protein
MLIGRYVIDNKIKINITLGCLRNFIYLFDAKFAQINPYPYKIKSGESEQFLSLLPTYPFQK